MRSGEDVRATRKSELGFNSASAFLDGGDFFKREVAGEELDAAIGMPYKGLRTTLTLPSELGKWCEGAKRRETLGEVSGDSGEFARDRESIGDNGVEEEVLRLLRAILSLRFLMTF